MRDLSRGNNNKRTMVLRRQQQEFTSEGFDLDALAAAGDGSDGDVIYEIGGGASAVETPSANETTTPSSPNNNEDATQVADDYKAQGNEAFKEKNFLEAIDMYSAAIQALPGLTAKELLQMQTDYEKEQHAVMRQRLAEQDERRRRRSRKADETSRQDDNDDDDDDNAEQKQDEPLPPFTAPPHVHAERLAVLHANRAAALMGLAEFLPALQDCHAAILWKPNYTKALLRRAAIYEKGMEDTEKALADAKMAQTLEPTSKPIRVTVQRLQKLEDERLEKLKAETLVSSLFSFLY